MILEYINSFNSGELSPYIAGRADLENYRKGCYKLENMYVLPYGGVERRTGTQFMGEALSENTKLISFDFSEDNSYIVEIGINLSGDGKLRIHDSNGYAGVELDSPYESSELSTIKYSRIFDVIYLTCPTKPVYTLSRTKLSPLTFELNEFDYIYPPFLEENEDTNIYTIPKPLYWISGIEYPSGSQVQYDGGLYTTSGGVASGSTFVSGDWEILYQESVNVDAGDEIIIQATSGSDLFTEDMIGSYWRMRHDRSESKTADEGTLYNQDDTSEEISVDSISYSVNINNTTTRYLKYIYTSSCVIESNTGSGWTTLETYNTAGSFTYNGSGTSNERIRVRKIDADVFTSDNPTATYKIRTISNRRLSGTVSTSANYTTGKLDVSFSDWEISTGGTWTGTVELEKSIDGGVTWNTELVVGDTNGIEARNFVVTSPAKEIANTFIRLKFTYESGTFKYNMNVQSIYSEGIVIITDYISSTEVQAIVYNRLGAPGATNRWTEGAFSDRRGYPNAIDIFEDRLIFAGTSYDPSTIWMSVVGDYANFQLGTNDDEGIKISPSNAEPTEWLLSRKDIFQGSRGGLNNINSLNSNSSITPSTIKSSKVTSYGSAPIQAIYANDVAVYFQRLGKKLRTIEYSYEDQSFFSTDLSILASHITNDGITEMVYQQTPDQIIWCLREDGILAGLTFERTEEVIGWHRHDYNGEIKSIAIRPSSGEDELWIAIKRNGGTYIEKSKSREFSDDLLDTWYVDSGVEFELQSTLSGSYEVSAMSDFSIQFIVDNILSDGDKIRIETATGGLSGVIGEVFTVTDSTPSSFFISDKENIGLINYKTIVDYYPDNYIIEGAGLSGVNTTLYFQSISEGKPIYNDGELSGISMIYDTDRFTITDEVSGVLYYNITNNNLPSIDNWFVLSGTSPAPSAVYGIYDISGGDISFIQVDNTWTGLDHLEGEFVQVQGDGGYELGSIVSGGQIVTDDYYNLAIIGKPFVSLLQPMFIEPVGGLNPVGRKKNLNSAILKFYRTIGAIVGTRNLKIKGSDVVIDSNVFRVDIDDSEKENLDEYHNEFTILRNTEDILGRSLVPYTGDTLVYLNDDWSRIKDIYVVQNLPLPMTVLNMCIDVKIGRDV